MVAADLTHDVAGATKFVAQQDLHLAAHAPHLLLWHTEKEVLLRSRPRLAVLVGKGEPRGVADVGAAAVQECTLEDAKRAGAHRQLKPARGILCGFAARQRCPQRRYPFRGPFVAPA